MNDLKTIIAKIADAHPLSYDEACHAFEIVMSGHATPSQIGGFLMALRVRGESVDEITAAASTMRSKMLKVTAPEDAIDIVGTGGDSSGSYNISTATAFVVAGCGVPVAKHGNRALSSRAGTADTLKELGINLDLDANQITTCIRTAGLGFMFAPNHHSAMRYVGPSRVELGTRTIFNLVGPLTNPAGVTRQLVGVFSKEWVEPVAKVLLSLGSTKAWVVHGDGMDEITTTGTTYVSAIENGEITNFKITPQDVGLPMVTKEDLKGGDPEHNCAALCDLLSGNPSPYRDVTLMNAAAALIIAGHATSLKEGVELAAHSIDDGHAQNVLNLLVNISNQ